MTSTVIFFLVGLVLFSIAFIMKRRFGVLGLALAAGAMLSALWVGDLTPLIAQAGIVLIEPPLESVVAAALILLPALLVMVGGPVYHVASQRTIGALLFTLLATVLLLPAIGSAVVIDGMGQQIYDFLNANRIMIITVCLFAALFDVITTKPPKIPGKH